MEEIYRCRQSTVIKLGMRDGYKARRLVVGGGGEDEEVVSVSAYAVCASPLYQRESAMTDE